ncbi:MAG: enoyl-CoA hydratase/isomerase family protein [Deferribacterota bacterium]|nr:enoyl-CoA hydratase/isomerase family protein [Deferribacterota bacterium]
MGNVIYEKMEGTAIIRLNRPEKKNALNLELIENLGKVLKNAEEDKEVRVVVITGSGNNFSSGADLTDPTTIDMMKQEFSQSSTMIRLINLEKPTIAAVDGYALGHGAEYMLMCDIVIASDRAIIGFIGPQRGVVCPYAMIRLGDEIGRSKAKELIWTCDRISASTALEIGLINKVVLQEELMNEVLSFAKKLIKSSPTAIKLIKKAINRGLNDYKYAKDLFDESLESKDFIEGVTSFMERRDPKWIL